MQRLDDKIALVTGGSRGIGKSIALELAKLGAKVAINYHGSKDKADAVAEEIRALGTEALVIQADVGEAESARNMVKQVLDQWGRLDVLVNNAGITKDTTFKKMTDEAWHAVINTNLNSVYYVTSAALPSMLENNFGRIINISSFVGQAGNFGQTNYAASKGAVIAFTKSLAKEVARNNITVNAVAPGFTATEMVAAIPEKVQEKILANVPQQRFGEPEEVARGVAYLAAEGAYITGQQLNINGGVYM
ncbi:3-oxoacyl-[acyl-carrier-protein] reductase [Alkalispirillum mobile]|uniref:3-oxoacyl-[acyl-carrier-protein] reductase n=1 Tax=Alkalispirillum mobile TaxID=85925 RepID=A0A498BZ85_9GAMM|nr:3-oxoacyl-[acyl-carrier-protein] reductase [Alkalispirillum mobile]RLK48752.1 3-oxoacyl-[acyl-carrier-protein] reductase [Alkalispirillum mobile]